MEYRKIITTLKQKANPKNLEGMVRFGINLKNTLGVAMPEVRQIAKKIGKNQELSLKLWQSRIHEARILASIIGEADKVSEKQMDNWVKDFDSWDVCDQVIMNLFNKTPFAFKKAQVWVKSKKEFTRRAGFVMMAALAVHNKKATDKNFLPFFALIKKHATDERNFVRKAVNWALRQIGKRNPNLKKKALKLGKEILKIDSKTAHWIARDAIRELKNKVFV